MVNWLSPLDRKLLRDLLHMTGQGVAVSIIVACGVAILVMALGALTSLEQSRDTYYERYRFADIFADVKRAPERLITDIRNIDGVRIAETRISRIVTLDIETLNEPANARLISLPENGRPALNDVHLYQGRWPDVNRPDEAIVSEAFTIAHGYQIGDQVTALINGHARDVEIVGIGDSPEFIYMLGPGSLLPDEERFAVFWMGERALEAAFDLDGAFNSVNLSLAPHTNQDDVIIALDRLLAPYGAIGAYDRSDQISNAFISSEMQQLRSMARVIPPVFLMVSALLIHAILARLIATERQQVGLLKAFGYSNREVGWHYVKFAITLTIGGVLLGFVLGAVLARLLTYLFSDSFRFPEILFTLPPSAFLISSLAAFTAAVIGALNAAIQAASLLPAEAMSPAPPTIYRKGILRNSRWAQSLDEPSRMIIRHMTRWPLRAAMTATGIAAAMALLVGTLFAFDSIDAIIETEFYRTNPHDASIQFAEPRDPRAILEMSRMEGVVAIEPIRDAFVRFRFNQATERGVVTGLTPNSQLKNIMSRTGEKIEMPVSGLVTSSQLAGMLGAERGDIVSIESLEGRRWSADVPIVAISDDSIGMAAYMHLRSLNALLGESEIATGAVILVDPDKQDAFGEAVLDHPIIASVATRRAVLASFEETMNETIYVMMSIYALIGGAIAAGVVYNAARIALTERGRELASLRVLGFTSREATYILVGELAVLILVGIPVGAFAGAGLAWAVSTGMATELYRAPFVIEPSTYGAAGVIILLASAISALLVARRVRTLDLIEVLKTRE